MGVIILSSLVKVEGQGHHNLICIQKSKILSWKCAPLKLWIIGQIAYCGIEAHVVYVGSNNSVQFSQGQRSMVTCLVGNHFKRSMQFLLTNSCPSLSQFYYRECSLHGLINEFLWFPKIFIMSISDRVSLGFHVTLLEN